MAKRKTFYIPAGIFEGGHSAYAVAVYAYLCFCADRQGVCFPGMDAIASRTGTSRSTVKRALTELEQSGLIRSETTSQLMKNGKYRQSTNRYRLTDVPVKTAPDPGFRENPSPGSEGTPPPVHCEPLPPFTGNPSPRSQGTSPRFPVNREINNNSKDIMGDVPSVGINARERHDRSSSSSFPFLSDRHGMPCGAICLAARYTFGTIYLRHDMRLRRAMMP